MEKDFSSEVLATALGADRLLFLTDVEHAVVSFGTDRELAIERLTLREARALLGAGEFSPGSMGPKIEAGIRFVEAGGREAIVTVPSRARAALEGEPAPGSSRERRQDDGAEVPGDRLQLAQVAGRLAEHEVEVQRRDGRPLERRGGVADEDGVETPRGQRAGQALGRSGRAFIAGPLYPAVPGRPRARRASGKERTAMKGVVFLGERELELRDFPDPAPGPGEVVIAIKGSGMCGSDLHAYRAARGGNAAAALGLGGQGSPVIAGHEPCGVVAARGAGVPEAAAPIGARVMNHHYKGCGACKHCRLGWSQLCPRGIVRLRRDGPRRPRAASCSPPPARSSRCPTSCRSRRAPPSRCGTGHRLPGAGAARRLRAGHAGRLRPGAGRPQRHAAGRGDGRARRRRRRRSPSGGGWPGAGRRDGRRSAGRGPGGGAPRADRRRGRGRRARLHRRRRGARGRGAERADLGARLLRAARADGDLRDQPGLPAPPAHGPRLVDLQQRDPGRVRPLRRSSAGCPSAG